MVWETFSFPSLLGLQEKKLVVDDDDDVAVEMKRGSKRFQRASRG